MNRLKQLRLEANLSLRELQNHVRIDYSRIAKIEKSDHNIESKTLQKFLDFFMINYSYFNGGDGLIYFYDSFNECYFPLAYNQFKEIIDNAKVTVSIVDNKVRRIISDKDLDKISNSLNVQTITLNRRIKILQIIKDAENMDINEIEMLKEGIDELYYQKLKKK